jgi:hypothetical protein
VSCERELSFWHALGLASEEMPTKSLELERRELIQLAVFFAFVRCAG